MQFTRMLLTVTVGMLLASPALLAAEPGELADPRWWFRQAEAALKQIKDPEAHTLIKQIVGQMQGASLSPVQAQTAVDEQLATLRTQLPPEEEWRYQYLAAQVHGTAHQYPAALQALTRGRALAAARFTDKALKNIVETFDRQLGNQASAAARHGDAEIAIEMVTAIEDARTRDSARASLSQTLATNKQLKPAIEVATTIEDPRAQEETLANLVHIAVEHEPAVVEQVLERMTPAAAEQSRRMYWIRECHTGEQKAWERAIEGVLSFADPILLQKLERRSAGDLESCLNALNHQLEGSKVKVPIDEALGKRFLTLLEYYCERRYIAGEAAKRCRVSYLIATAQFDAALELERGYQNERTLANTQLQIAQCYLRLKQPEKALALCREIRGHEPSFELINAFRSAGEFAAALELAATIDELRYSAVPLNDIARDYDKLGDQAGVQRAVAALAVDDLRAICLASLAQQAIAAKQSTQADQYLIAAEKLLAKLPHDQFRDPAVNAVSTAYAQRGDVKAVARLVEAYGDGADRAARFLSVAYQRCEAKDFAGCKAAMVAF
ncbi:MAG TPA: hypothetical protein VL096_10435, partial [Pirellulaceae bacterium]|nr:hypothetical protein [Pirellulaceae bacterium]